jgi:hypothetical protein
MVRGEYISPYMDDAAGPNVADLISSDAAAATTNAAGAQAMPRVPKRERRRASLATVAESDELVAASSNPVQNPERLNSPMEQSSPPPIAAPIRLLNLTLNSPMEQSSPPPLAAPVRLLNFGGADLLAEAAEVAAAAGILSHIASDDDTAATLRAELLRPRPRSPCRLRAPSRGLSCGGAGEWDGRTAQRPLPTAAPARHRQLASSDGDASH